MSSQYTREELVYLAKLAEQCERYDGKLTHMFMLRQSVCLCTLVQAEWAASILAVSYTRAHAE